MGVQDGFPVSASYTNPRFISKNIPDVMPFILAFTNAGSGASVSDIQAAVNKLYTATGASEIATGTVYNAPPSTISNGDNYQTALSLLAGKFDSATGHMHTGNPGDAPPIDADVITNFPPLGYLLQGSTLAATGSGVDITSLFSGKTPSTNPATIGVPINNPANKVRILSAETATGHKDIVDEFGNLVFGRVSSATGSWSLDFYTYVDNVETPYTFLSPEDIYWWYQELYYPNEIPPVYLPVNDLFTAGGGGSEGVTSIAASGFMAATGAIILQEGTGIVIDQIGTDIEIAVGIVPLSSGGTGNNYGNNNALLNGILPSQTGQSGKVLTSNGTDTSWTTGGFSNQTANTVFAGPVSGAAAAPTFRALATQDFVAPTVQIFTGGSGTYNLPSSPRAPLFIKVTLVGPSGGGGGSGSAGAGAGGSGSGATTFGTITAPAGTGSAGATAVPGAGGAAGVNGDDSVAGASGQPSYTSVAIGPAGAGGVSTRGGAGAAGGPGAAGGNAAANSGSGGGGAGPTTGVGPTAGGGAGATTWKIITSPSSTYSYVVGSGGAGGTAGTSGFVGGNGAAGIIIVEEFYQ